MEGWYSGFPEKNSNIKIFSKCLIFTVQKKTLAPGIQALWTHVHVRWLSRCQCFLGGSLCRVLLLGSEGDVVLTDDATVCGAGQGQVPLDGLLGTLTLRVTDTWDTKLVSQLQVSLPGHGRVDGFAFWKNS